jgi:NAD(P)-dependent dehydrogenase (short-subunit alcohol dehydrogenase family)
MTDAAIDNSPRATDAPFSLAGSAALVTGATRGLGRAIAIELARAGADVALGMRGHDDRAGHAEQSDHADLVDEIERFGVRALPLRMDVLDLSESRAAIDRAAAEFGRLDILVNNVGGGISEPAIDVTADHFDHVWALNTRSTFFLAQHAARLMRASGGGSIVNVASQAGLVALPGEASYCISKAAVIHLTRCLAVEWGELGIRVNAVAPTFIETDGTSEALSDEAFKADTIERIAALHRIGKPTEVSGAVAFLCSPAASLITGQTLAIDGGWTAR